ncbi:YceD family protein [Eupransor demetentiae]|uniref:Uncharacterized in bacteria (YceD n=1 Tax=Eupransor demetentiae TaxID=3109584 RepID=A0ABM9N641_9LACO|nr:23S rRNA accumulation protein YceD (essential in plants [Lactobacillaceae bacterium LMG 33000]
MKFSKQQLIKYRQEPLVIDESIDLAPAVAERFSDLILSVSPLQVKAQIQSLDNDDIILSAKVTGDAKVPSSRSLEPVDFPIDMDIQERYLADPSRLDDYEDDEMVFAIEKDTIDLDKIILDNLVASLPSQILTKEEAASDALPKGQDWQVISEKEFQQEENKKEEEKPLDPRLAKLDDFFK